MSSNQNLSEMLAALAGAAGSSPAASGGTGSGGKSSPSAGSYVFIGDGGGSALSFRENRLSNSRRPARSKACRTFTPNNSTTTQLEKMGLSPMNSSFQLLSDGIAGSKSDIFRFLVRPRGF